jgi:hypothetical protein
MRFWSNSKQRYAATGAEHGQYLPHLHRHLHELHVFARTSMPALLPFLRLLRPRNDTKAGRVGRRGDRVGGPYYMHRDDLSKLAPQWYNWTKIMRTDMEVGGASRASAVCSSSQSQQHVCCLMQSKIPHRHQQQQCVAGHAWFMYPKASCVLCAADGEGRKQRQGTHGSTRPTLASVISSFTFDG